MYLTEKELAHAPAGVSCHVCVWRELVPLRDGATGGPNHRQAGQKQAPLHYSLCRYRMNECLTCIYLMQRHQTERSPSEKLLLLRDMEARKYLTERACCVLYFLFILSNGLSHIKSCYLEVHFCDAMCSAFILLFLF